MKELLKRIFLNDKIIMAVIIVNAIVIFFQESGFQLWWIDLIDVICTFIFLVEMIVKQRTHGVKAYWKSPINCMDAILVFVALPSVISFCGGPALADGSVFLVLRIFRIFRFFRLMRMFPNVSVILSNFKLAMRQSYAIMLAFVIIIITFALINSCLFGDYAPDYFQTPLDAIYSTFRLFTVEGWYEIPDAVVTGMGIPEMLHAIRLYFSLLLLGGGIIGMSLINSIFVDAMVSDNNDDVKDQLRRVEEKLDRLLAEKEGKSE